VQRLYASYIGQPEFRGTSPEGTVETLRDPSAVPPGLVVSRTLVPNVETLGYCRMSLRDNDLARFCGSSLGANPSGIGQECPRSGARCSCRMVGFGRYARRATASRRCSVAGSHAEEQDRARVHRQQQLHGSVGAGQRAVVGQPVHEVRGVERLVGDTRDAIPA
jgi:hypothetical protein